MTNLILTNCQNLQEINASGNRLEEVVFPNQAPNLTGIYLTNNNPPFARFKLLFSFY
ncbi:leucine-rich repeat domain-containing protein [endosymbiont GvMRE of Glomus versiforme]|uniref:leucine-rich repeat domain-containing protein n=1 Tax=endosymbiont GvMRE of Glomus versiforme TaxID=2039283 RepID=UPI0015594ABC